MGNFRDYDPAEPVMSEQRALESIPTRILLPIDFSPSSEMALETAADLARHSGAEFFLVNALPLLSTFASEYAVPRAQFQLKEQTRTEKQLAKVGSAPTARE